jgi:hypothetical protein
MSKPTFTQLRALADAAYDEEREARARAHELGDQINVYRNKMPMHMRSIDEQRVDLERDIRNLCAQVNTPDFQALPEGDATRSATLLQLTHMRGYSSALGDRLNAWAREVKA